CLLFFFFFQAEDGIRDRNVTGVQTCALPICSRSQGRQASHSSGRGSRFSGGRHLTMLAMKTFLSRARSTAVRYWSSSLPLRPTRSEERRVGKEWRSRWWREERAGRTKVVTSG